MTDRWLTYQQAGEQLGLSVEAVRQRARRRRWRTQPGNDGRTLVLIPDQPDGQPHGQASVRSHVQPYAQLPPHLGEVEALRDLVANLQAQVTKLEAQAEQQRLDHLAQMVKAEAALERERQDLKAERERQVAAREVWEARLDGLAADLAEARQTRLAEAEANARREVELQQLHAELERLRARPWWRRMFGAG
jgi:DNA repair exonuclease SbcCD ATPase subunit